MKIQHYQTFSVFKIDLLEKRCRGKHTFVGLGSSRGGTSLLSYVLLQAGVPMGNTNELTHEDHLILNNISNKFKLRKIFADRNVAFDTWGFKLPAATFLVDWLDIELRNPIFIFVIRNIASVARSILKYDPIYGQGLKGYSDSLQHAMRYYSHVVSSIKRIESPIIIIEFEKVLTNPESFVDDFFQLLHLQVEDEITTLIKKQLAQPGYKKIATL